MDVDDIQIAEWALENCEIFIRKAADPLVVPELGVIRELLEKCATILRIKWFPGLLVRSLKFHEDMYRSHTSEPGEASVPHQVCWIWHLHASH